MAVIVNINNGEKQYPMDGIVHFETFLITGILLNLTPGNDTIFILAKSIAKGKKAGMVAALGITSGSVVHTLLAALGLSVIIAKSIIVFDIVKYAGAAYLVLLDTNCSPTNRSHWQCRCQHPVLSIIEKSTETPC
ncbi:MAG: LysE family translocator [Chitinophagaceae bacterium]